MSPGCLTQLTIFSVKSKVDYVLTVCLNNNTSMRMTRTHNIDPSNQRTDTHPKPQCRRSMRHHHLCLKQLTRMLPMEAMPTMSLCGNRARGPINSRPSRLSDALEHARTCSWFFEVYMLAWKMIDDGHSSYPLTA